MQKPAPTQAACSQYAADAASSLANAEIAAAAQSGSRSIISRGLGRDRSMTKRSGTGDSPGDRHDQVPCDDEVGISSPGAERQLVEQLRSVGQDALGRPRSNVSAGSQQLSASAEQCRRAPPSRPPPPRRPPPRWRRWPPTSSRTPTTPARPRRSPGSRPRMPRASGEAVEPRRGGDADHRREDHHRAGDRPPDRPAGAQRRGGSGARRRARQGLRGGRLRGAQARRAQPDGGGRDRRAVGRHGEGGAARPARC